MTDHDHDAQLAMFGMCPTCTVRERTGDDRLVVELDGSSLLVRPGDFDGATYQRARDHARLSGQLARVADALADGAWHTLAQLHQQTSDPEASISARIRDLRKGRFGGWTVEARSDGGGTWLYRLHPQPVANAVDGCTTT